MKMGKKQNAVGTGIEKLELKHLVPAEYNPRTISDEAMEGLKNSLARFGCVEPIVVNIRAGANRIVGGHQRHTALLKLGVKYAMCVTVDLSDTDERLLNITLNNPHLQGAFIKNIEEYIETLKGTIDEKDWIDFQIAKITGELATLGKVGMTDDNDIPEITERVVTQLGDTWQLGEHRLLCGDSTNIEDVRRVMGDQTARMCFTSPPYNMAADMYANYSDDMKSREYTAFNSRVAWNIKSVLKGFLFWNISYNANSRWEFIEIFYDFIKNLNYYFLENIVWDKGRAIPITSNTGLTRTYENVLLLASHETGYEIDFCFVGTTQKHGRSIKHGNTVSATIGEYPCPTTRSLKSIRPVFLSSCPPGQLTS